MEQVRINKINHSKFNRMEKMKALNSALNSEEALLRLNICYKTLKTWKKKMEFVKRIDEVTIDRALKEMLFTDKSQIECFEFMVKDFNYFCTFDEINKHVKITRYYYKIVKDYIHDELIKLN